MKCYGYKVYTGDWDIPLGTVVIAEDSEQAKKLGREAILEYLLNGNLKNDNNWTEADIRTYANRISNDFELYEIDWNKAAAFVLGDREDED